MADWAGLLDDLLFEIGKRVRSIESYNSFGAVCRSWRAAATKEHLKQKTFQGPWLMLAEKEEDMREFLSVSSGKTCKIFLPQASKKRCLSCQDWLFIVAEDEIHVSLLHPVSGVQIHLPKLNTFPDYDFSVNNNLHFIEKVVLSANPSSTSDFIVMVLWGGLCQLGFWKPGDTSWTATDEWPAAFSDIIYCNNHLYAVDYPGRIVRCDVHGQNSTQLQQIFDLSLPPEQVERVYLVEFSNKFLILHRYVFEDDEYYKTEKIKVSEVNIKDGKWVEIKDLGNKALFLGYNSSFSIECSELNKCKPNCIYFSDDCMEIYLSLKLGGGKDTGIYHLSDGSIEPLFDEIVCSKVTPPTWIVPSF